VKCWSAPRSKAALAGVIAIETRDREGPGDGPGDGPPTPGPRLPAPQPMNKLRHTKTIGARSGFTGLVRPVAWDICRRRASSSDRLLMLTNAFTAGWLGSMAISGQTQPQEFSLYRYCKGKSDPEQRQMVQKTRYQGGQNKRPCSAVSCLLGPIRLDPLKVSREGRDLPKNGEGATGTDPSGLSEECEFRPSWAICMMIRPPRG
jgi:hypothetical protein